MIAPDPAPSRPLGIAVLALFAFIAALVAAVSAISLAFPGSPLEPIWRLNPPAREAFTSMHGWAVPLLAMLACACVCAGVGLWRVRRWGYLLTLAGLSLHLLGDVASVVSGIEPRAAIGIPIVAALLVYLRRGRIRRAFEEG